MGELFNKTHGMAGREKTKEYKTWVGMKQRCSNPKNPAWSNYGGRGIKVCDRWRDSFEAFLEDVGKAPVDDRKCQLDRIENDGNYEPGNVRWTDAKTNGRNKRTNRMVEHEGRMVTMAEKCEALGIKQSVVQGRLHWGYDFDRALHQKLRKRGRKQFVEWDGERVSLAVLGERFGHSKDVIYRRMKRGWSLEEALKTPSREMCTRLCLNDGCAIRPSLTGKSRGVAVKDVADGLGGPLVAAVPGEDALLGEFAGYGAEGEAV